MPSEKDQRSLERLRENYAMTDYASRTRPRPVPEGYVINGFEALPGESEEAYESYIAYRDMGQGRTLLGCAEQIGRHPVMIKQRAHRERWYERVSAYDLFVISEEQAAIRKSMESRALELTKQRMQLQDEEWRAHETLMKKADAMSKWPLTKTETSRDGKHITYIPAKWSLFTMVQIYELASQLARRSTEMPNTYQQVDANIALQAAGGMDTSAMSVEERERFNAAQAAAARVFLEMMEGQQQPEMTARVVEDEKAPDWYVPQGGPRAFADEPPKE